MGNPLTVRLDEKTSVDLKALATFDRVTLAEEIREAIGLLLEARKSDPKYRQRVQTAFEEAKAALVKLKGTKQIVKALGDPFEESKPSEATSGEKVKAVARAVR